MQGVLAKQTPGADHLGVSFKIKIIFIHVAQQLADSCPVSYNKPGGPVSSQLAPVSSQLAPGQPRLVSIRGGLAASRAEPVGFRDKMCREKEADGTHFLLQSSKIPV